MFDLLDALEDLRSSDPERQNRGALRVEEFYVNCRLKETLPHSKNDIDAIRNDALFEVSQLVKSPRFEKPASEGQAAKLLKAVFRNEIVDWHRRASRERLVDLGSDAGRVSNHSGGLSSIREFLRRIKSQGIRRFGAKDFEVFLGTQEKDLDLPRAAELSNKTRAAASMSFGRIRAWIRQTFDPRNR